MFPNSSSCGSESAHLCPLGHMCVVEVSSFYDSSNFIIISDSSAWKIEQIWSFMYSSQTLTKADIIALQYWNFKSLTGYLVSSAGRALGFHCVPSLIPSMGLWDDYGCNSDICLGFSINANYTFPQQMECTESSETQALSTVWVFKPVQYVCKHTRRHSGGKSLTISAKNILHIYVSKCSYHSVFWNFIMRAFLWSSVKILF